jgi:hypothetical protein
MHSVQNYVEKKLLVVVKREGGYKCRLGCIRLNIIGAANYGTGCEKFQNKVQKTYPRHQTQYGQLKMCKTLPGHTTPIRKNRRLMDI